MIRKSGQSAIQEEFVGKPYLNLTLTNGLDKLFQIKVDHDVLQTHRKKTGIEGSWQSYFSLFCQAVETKSVTLKFSDS